MVDLTNLKKSTREFPNLDVFVSNINATIDYDLKVGSCIGTNLFNNKQIAVQNAFMCKGSIFPMHKHKEHEYLLIYVGKLEVKNGDTLILKKGDVVHFKPNEQHSVKALENTYLVGITMPASAGYPK